MNDEKNIIMQIEENVGDPLKSSMTVVITV